MGTLYIEAECKAEKEKRHGIHWKLHLPSPYIPPTHTMGGGGGGGWQHGTRYHIYITVFIHPSLKSQGEFRWSVGRNQT